VDPGTKRGNRPENTLDGRRIGEHNPTNGNHRENAPMRIRKATSRAGAVVILLATGSNANAVTKYWITRAATCSTYNTHQQPGVGNRTGRDALQAYTDRRTFGYCDVKLPDNATIKSGRAYGSDTSLQQMTFSVRKASYCAEDYTAIVTWSSTDNVEEPACTQAQWVSAIVTEAVDNANNAHYFYFEIPYAVEPDLLRLWNVEIQYQVS
jgi:hypothetical protein